MAFPYVFPGAYTKPEPYPDTTFAYGLIHSPSPYSSTTTYCGLLAATESQSAGYRR